MKTIRLVTLALSTLALASCATDDRVVTNIGPGAVTGNTAGWTTGMGGMSGTTRDSGSSIRGAGVGAGTSGSAGTGWIVPNTREVN